MAATLRRKAGARHVRLSRRRTACDETWDRVSIAPRRATAYGEVLLDDDLRPLALAVGCTFGFSTPQPVPSVLQVAPTGGAVQIDGERWDTGTDHHGYRRLLRQPLRAADDPCRRVADRLRRRGRARRAARPARPRHARDAGLRAARRAPALRDAQPLLPARRARARGLAALREPGAGLGARPGDRRLRPRPPGVGRAARRTRGRRPPTPTAPARASAATSPTSPSPSAAR